ncbi:flagellar protein FlgN [Halalkalibacter alkaliphilus]|uniref:Flagellar protein FlgN n=1 Tax=Halalkalibacter alkaliphilus TaxID=2917993 RepID=A0A9X2CR39_9BACI|nr:flagellar protein FlgN [Halalkalibacter alkaliphilus]MCL7746741.1 flagellar protein FlgN [Halalkalibacter alkaliphilus]
MSLNAVIQLIERLIEIHEKLYSMAKKKVEPIKKGDMPVLGALVREESKLIRMLQTTELMRGKVVRTFLLEKGEVKEDATISDVMKLASADEKKKLDELQKKLRAQVKMLKEQNDLNQELIEESLRFVNLSLDLIVPHKEDISYNPKERDDEPYETGHSLFDSKA